MLVVATTAVGQGTGIALSGFVRDPSGARIPSVFVLITDARGEVTEAATSGADGAFRIEGLEPSTPYRVELRGPVGFEPLRQGLSLTADRSIDFKLGVAGIEETIVVSGKSRVPAPTGARAERRRIRVGGSVRKARLVHHVPAVYPPDAERDGVEGTVLMQGDIDSEGRLLGLTTLNSNVDDRLAAAAREAVTQWRYEPTLLNGRPIEVSCTVSVAFHLP